MEETTLTAIYNDLAMGSSLPRFIITTLVASIIWSSLRFITQGSDAVAMGGLRIDDGVSSSSQVPQHLVAVTISSSRRQLSFEPMNTLDGMPMIALAVLAAALSVSSAMRLISSGKVII